MSAEIRDKLPDSGLLWKFHLDKTEVVLENHLPKKLASEMHFVIAIVILSRLFLKYIPKQSTQPHFHPQHKQGSAPFRGTSLLPAAETHGTKWLRPLILRRALVLGGPAAWRRCRGDGAGWVEVAARPGTAFADRLR